MAVITVTTEPVIDIQTHTPTFYDKLAGDLMPVLDQITGVIPKMDESEAVTAKSVRSGLFASDAFCADAIDAVEQIAELAASKRLDPVLGRNQLQFLIAFRPVEHKLTAVARRVTHALRAVKSDLAMRSLQVYRLAQGLASDERSPGVSAHVEAMKRDLGRRVATKAVRDQRRAERFEAAVQAEVEKRVQAAVEQRLREVKAA
ncbi:MAG TPA: hypothetical protein VF432_11355 [Thermoanaerobaculia bacterium]